MISEILIVGVGLIQNPNWIIEFWNTGNAKLSSAFGISPTIWGVSSFFCNYARNCALGYGICIGLFFLTGYLYIALKKQSCLSPSLAVSLAIALTLLLTPYTWTYDQLLLVAPIVIATLLLAKDKYGFLPVSLLFLGIDVAALLLLIIATKIQLDIWNVIIPLFVFLLLAWYIVKDKSTALNVEAKQFKSK